MDAILNGTNEMNMREVTKKKKRKKKKIMKGNQIMVPSYFFYAFEPSFYYSSPYASIFSISPPQPYLVL